MLLIQKSHWIIQKQYVKNMVQNTSIRNIQALVVHSVLHLLGYDHLDEGEQKRQMRGREEAILAELGVTREG